MPDLLDPTKSYQYIGRVWKTGAFAIRIDPPDVNVNAGAGSVFLAYPLELEGKILQLVGQVVRVDSKGGFVSSIERF